MAQYFTNIQNSYPPFTPDGKTAFFCHSSYEPRALASIKSSERCCGIDSTFIFHTNDYLGNEIYEKNHSEMVAYFSTVSANAPVEVSIDADIKDGLIHSYQDSIRESLSQADDIAVDMSTFTRGRMICLLDFIIREKGDKPLYLFYAEPEKYATENYGGDSAWLTKGTKSIVSVPGFLGEKQPDKKQLLILLLGHDVERVGSVVEDVDPDMIVVVSQGALKSRKKLQEASLKSNACILQKYGDRITTILTAPARGWETVYDAFARIFGMYRNQYNITAYLDGTKMQVFGAVTFCQKNPSVELLYMEPEKYNCDFYTDGIGTTWWLEVPNMDMFKKR
ncbi:MAG: hypothetical protein GY746_02600 [Gammaproteobacteria bacterium]|nr:hypothetical protein [Gammaproteobacteria bacterium]